MSKKLTLGVALPMLVGDIREWNEDSLEMPARMTPVGRRGNV